MTWIGFSSFLWMTMRSARRSASISISGRLIERHVHAGLDPRAKKMLSRLVAHIAMSAPLMASSGWSTGAHLDAEHLGHLRREASRFSRVGAEAADLLDVAHGAGRHELRARLPAGAEDADRLGFLRARYLMPRPLVAPTRMRCMTPSGMIASGSPFSTENNSTRPT